MNIARFDTYSYYSCRGIDINARLDIKLLQSQWRSRAPGHNACLKGRISTSTMQGLTLAAIIAVEKKTLC